MKKLLVFACLAATPFGVSAREQRVDPNDYAAVAAAITKTEDSYSGYRDVTGPKIYDPKARRPLFFSAVDAVTKTGDAFALIVTGEFTGNVTLTGAAANGHDLQSSVRPTEVLACNQWGCLRRVGITILLDRATLDGAKTAGLKFRVYTETTGALDLEAPAPYIRAVADAFDRLKAPVK